MNLLTFVICLASEKDKKFYLASIYSTSFLNVECLEEGQTSRDQYWRIARFEVAHVQLPSAKSKDCQDFEINISHDVKVVQSCFFSVFISTSAKEPFVLK